MDKEDENKKIKRREYYKEYYKKNLDKAVIYRRKYYYKNYEVLREKMNKYNKIYKAKNREKVNKYAREMYWIKQGKPVPEAKTKTKKYNTPIKKTKIKDLSKLQKKTHDIEASLADLLVKKQEFIKKLEEEKGELQAKK
jgi:predicted transcriptional regulator